MSYGFLPSNCHGTIRPAARALVINDCRQLARSMGADKRPLDFQACMKLLLSRSNKQRQSIRNYYPRTFIDMDPATIDLQTDILKTFGQEWNEFLTVMFEPWADFEANRIHRAILEGDDSMILEILLGLDSPEVEAIVQAFEKQTGLELSRVVEKFSERLISSPVLLAIVKECRDNLRDPLNDEVFLVQPENLRRDAKFMVATPVDEWLSADRTTFVRLIGHENFAHIHAALRAFEFESCQDVETVVAERNFNDERMKKVMKVIIQLVKNQPAYFARRFHECFQTHRREGDDIADLITLLFSRSERDLFSITRVYETLYGETMATAINRCVEGNFKALLQAIVQGN